MSSQDLSPGYYPSAATNGVHPRALAPAKFRQRYWLHALMFALTLASTTIVGSRMQANFDRNLPFFDLERDIAAFALLWRNPMLLLPGLPFSLTLLTILLAHEFGHFFACVYYRIDASLPYFLPAPTFTGTLGAFIRIRAPIYSKRVLFDVGVAGPIAGFVFLLPALAIGLAFSKIIPGISHQGAFSFGTPALLWLLERAVFPGVPVSDVYLHPVARAAWIGILATALNLLPIGQLDGGHILYSMVGDRHKLMSRVFAALLVPIGIFFWSGWLVWAVLLLLFGMRHPAIYDPTDLGPGRKRLAWLSLSIFLVCFTLAPISYTGGF
ncbi:MAG TPA: site-2 protease family protein [Bryobacteraceae bacterium]|nr:site-2 protease family protein [Bryobacteraceae bacterium]